MFRRFLAETAQKEFRLINIISSVDDFCSKIKTIRGFKFVQVDNMFSRMNDLFKMVYNYGGLDYPSKLLMQVTYGDIPVHQGRALIDKLCRNKEEFEHVIVIGSDDDGIEQTFDFSSIIERIELRVQKDATDHYDAHEVKALLLSKLR